MPWLAEEVPMSLGLQPIGRRRRAFDSGKKREWMRSGGKRRVTGKRHANKVGQKRVIKAGREQKMTQEKGRYRENS